MSYLLNAVTIKAPIQMTVENNTQMAQNRTISGAVVRDHFGANKRTWTLTYRNISKTAFDIINNEYTSYLANSTAVTWESTETNYTIAQTTVHIDLQSRGFTVGGADYISDFDLVLTEA